MYKSLLSVLLGKYPGVKFLHHGNSVFNFLKSHQTVFCSALAMLTLGGTTCACMKCLKYLSTIWKFKLEMWIDCIVSTSLRTYIMSWDLFICFECHRAPACVSHFTWLNLHFSIHSHLFCALYSNECLLIHWLDVHHILKCHLKTRSVYRKHVGIVSRFCFATVTIWNCYFLWWQNGEYPCW